MNINTLTVEQLTQAAEIKKRLETATTTLHEAQKVVNDTQNELVQLLGVPLDEPKPDKRRGPRGPMSPEAKAKIGEAQRKRWEKQHRDAKELERLRAKQAAEKASAKVA